MILATSKTLGQFDIFPFNPYPLFEWGPQSSEIFLNLGMKYWNSTFNAQDSRAIIIIVQVVAVKIYVASVGGAQEKERGDETLVEKLD